jgi:hypothetical protein
LSLQAEIEWRCRWYRDGDEDGILALMRPAFGRWPRVEVDIDPLDHLRWKMSSSPIARSYGSVAETSDGTIIAVQLFFAQDVFVQGNRRRLIQGVDQCVHPDYQGRGVIRSLRGFAWPTFGRLFDMRIGMTGQKALDTLRRREGSRPIGNAVDVLLATTSQAPRKACRSVERPVSSLNHRFEDLATESAGDFSFIVRRDPHYLAWRYDARGGPFMFRTIEEAGSLLGYTVTRASHGRGYIADLLARPGRLDVVDDLVADVLTSLRAVRVDQVECWLPAHHPYRGVMARHGFAKKRALPLTYGSFGHVDLTFMDCPNAAIHFTAGDLDLV